MKSGFSLVELSIVLVILGLLTGGILTGQSLIRAAELRSVTTSIHNYQSAFYSFKDKYFYLPGDLPNATDFWTSAGGGGSGSGCFTADASGGSACNGNGDGKIYTAEGATGGSTLWEWGERFHTWVHLANAGLIEGSYTGKTDDASNSYAIVGGLNIPSAKVSNGLYDIYTTSSSASVLRFPVMRNHTTLTLLATSGFGVLTPEEIWNIDTKLDDGLPGTGKVGTTLSTAPSNTNCSTSNDAATARYSLAETITNCKLYAIMY